MTDVPPISHTPATLLRMRQWRQLAIAIDQILSDDPFSSLVTVDLVSKAMERMMQDVLKHPERALQLRGPVNRAINFIAALRHNPDLLKSITGKIFRTLAYAAARDIKPGGYFAPYAALLAAVREPGIKRPQEGLPPPPSFDYSHSRRLQRIYDNHPDLPRVEFLPTSTIIADRLDLSNIENYPLLLSLVQVKNEAWYIPMGIPFSTEQEAQKARGRKRQIMMLGAQEIVSAFRDNQRIINGRDYPEDQVAWAYRCLPSIWASLTAALHEDHSRVGGKWRATLILAQQRINRLMPRLH